MKKTINVTLKIDAHEIINFESWLNQQLEVVKLVIVPDTTKMYEQDIYFKNIIKGLKKAQRIRDKYINDNNFKYE